jgi:uncharacterized protein (DUF3084 family)
MEDMEDMYKFLQNEYMRLQKEKESLLTERRDALHRCNEKDEIINELRAKVDRLHTENEELKLFVPSDEELTDKKKKFETTIDQIEALKKENEFVRGELQVGNHLCAKLTDKCRDFEALRAELEKKEEWYNIINKENDGLRAINAGLQGKYLNALTALEEKDKEIDAFKKRIDDFYGNYNLRLNQIRDKNKENETLRAEIKKEHELNGMLMIMPPTQYMEGEEIKRLRVRVKELEVWKKIAEDVQRELELSTKRVKELEEKIESAKSLSFLMGRFDG